MNEPKIRVDVYNFDPTDKTIDQSGVSYHFLAKEPGRITDFMRMQAESGMYVVMNPYWLKEGE